MSDFEAALLIGLIVVALINIVNPRGLLWLAVGATNYIVTSAYYEAGLMLHPFFTACVDIFTCFLIYKVCMKFGGHNWELPLFTAFQFSVGVSFVMLIMVAYYTSNGFDRSGIDYGYHLLLELVNWAALLIIGGAGTARLSDALGSDRWSGGRGYLHKTMRFVSAPTRLRPWWWLAWAFSKAP